MKRRHIALYLGSAVTAVSAIGMMYALFYGASVMRTPQAAGGTTVPPAAEIALTVAWACLATSALSAFLVGFFAMRASR